jgi:hypothetical protein
MKSFQSNMHSNLTIAINALKSLSKQSREEGVVLINKVVALKQQMEALANQKGYSNACKTSIPTCKGECCKWHFPRNLNHIDFFIVIFNMSEVQQAEFSKIILNNNGNHCPVLLKNGCFLSFEQRPVLCTNAYPCFNERSYWKEKEKRNIQFKKVFDSLENLCF